jgi:serine/threonine protein kinase
VVNYQSTPKTKREKERKPKVTDFDL